MLAPLRNPVVAPASGRRPVQRSFLWDEPTAPVSPDPVRVRPAPDRPRPHPSGEPVVPTADPAAETLRRLQRVRIYLWQRRRTFGRRDVARALAAAGCPHRLWVLRYVWLLRRVCPACLLPIVPNDRATFEDGIAAFVGQQFCGDLCARYRDDLLAPTPEEIARATAEIRAGWADDEYPLRAGRLVDAPGWCVPVAALACGDDSADD